ncbi:MAG: ABC transporter permease subunit [Chloroflexi bacterium]|nr:ABC transporter permease subunit [Chloroflexota bacterium]
MQNIWVITKRELGSYFVSPIAYAVGAAFLVLSGLFFILPFFLGSSDASLRGWMQTIVVLLLFIAPMFTMKLLAEERQTGTIELLLTSPVRDWEVVIGKFLAALGLWLAILALTLVYPIALKIFGNPDLVPLVTGYLAMVLMGAAMLAVGVLSSAVSPNQIVAVVVGFAILLVLWIAAPLQNVFGGQVGSIVAYLSLTDHMGDLMKGVVDSRDIIYYLSVVVGCLFVSTRILETRRWS